MAKDKALKYASIWLLNPMVANISTRGSSEGLLAVMVVALLWAVLRGRAALAGVLLGLAVHFKIYPFIYAVSIFWWMDRRVVGSWDGNWRDRQGSSMVREFFNGQRRRLVLCSFASFMALNVLMVNL